MPFAGFFSHSKSSHAASMLSKSSREEPVARNITHHVGNYTLMHSWTLRCPCFPSCLISAGMETCWVTQQPSIHSYISS